MEFLFIQQHLNPIKAYLSKISAIKSTLYRLPRHIPSVVDRMGTEVVRSSVNVNGQTSAVLKYPQHSNGILTTHMILKLLPSVSAIS